MICIKTSITCCKGNCKVVRNIRSSGVGRFDRKIISWDIQKESESKRVTPENSSEEMGRINSAKNIKERTGSVWVV